VAPSNRRSEFRRRTEAEQDVCVTTSVKAGAWRLGVLLLTLATAMPAGAQSLPQQNLEILNELKAIRQLLEKLAGPLGTGGGLAPAPAAPAPAAVNEAVQLTEVSGQMLGRPDAPLTMVEFTDLQCPFCRQFHVTVFEQLKKEYIDTGKLRYFSRDLPLENLHPQAMTAARASRCAGAQGKFWDMRHAILINNAQLTAASFDTFAKDLKLDTSRFKACVAAAKDDAAIQRDIADASAAGITGTPSFVIGRTTAKGLDGTRLVGAQPFPAFDARLKALLGTP